MGFAVLFGQCREGDIFVRSIGMALSATGLIEPIIVLIAAPDARAALLAGPGFGCGRG